MLIDLLATRKLDDSVEFLCALAAAEHSVSAEACLAVVQACCGSLRDGDFAKAVSHRLSLLEAATQACGLLEHSLQPIADQTVECVSEWMLAEGAVTYYPTAARVVASCLNATDDKLALFHRSQSVDRRNARFSLLLSALALINDGEGLLAGLQRASTAGATLSEVAVGDCFSWMASTGLTDQFGALLAATRADSLTPRLLSGLFSACKDRGDVTTALSLLKVVHNHRIGNPSER